MTEPWRTRSLAVVIFAAAILSRDVLFAWSWYADLIQSLPETTRRLEQPVRWLSIVAVGLSFAPGQGHRSMLDRLGLRAPVLPALFFSFLACSPLLIGPWVLGEVSGELVLGSLLFSAVVWPLAEEILFRGYFFGQLYHFGGIRFWPAAILTGGTFGLLHLGQASVQEMPLSGEVGTVALIGVGGIFYAWLYVRWNGNLWVPFGMHMFMNGWWAVFDMADNPLGGWVPNVLRLLTVVTAIGITLYLGRESAPSPRTGEAPAGRG